MAAGLLFEGAPATTDAPSPETSWLPGFSLTGFCVSESEVLEVVLVTVVVSWDDLEIRKKTTRMKQAATSARREFNIAEELEFPLGELKG
jgi:hypothetical protein